MPRKILVQTGANSTHLLEEIAAEAAELVEIFQWLTPDESIAVRDSQSQKQSVEDELADILKY